MSKKIDGAQRIEVILEFLIFGIIIGVTEDIIAVKVVTDEPITLKVVGIIVFIAIPFAFLGEIIADRIDFSKYIRSFLNKRKTSK